MENQFAYQLSHYLEFRDRSVSRRVRNIKRNDITTSPSDKLAISVIEHVVAFRFSYVMNIVSGIKRAWEEGKKQYVLILPAPNPDYAFVAKMINDLKIPCHHVHTFNMDEYANEEGKTAPKNWKGGFQFWMYHDLFDRITPALRMSDEQIHFPNDRNINDYSKMLEDMGGADVCYGGIGWCGHIAFFEPHLGREFEDDLEGFLDQGSRIVDLHPITICQNSLYADAGSSGDWTWVPPKAATIGPRELRDSKLVSFWNGFGAGDSIWQRFITRLAAHGPVTPLVPASILQVIDSELILSGPVAADCSTETSEREIEITI